MDWIATRLADWREMNAAADINEVPKPTVSIKAAGLSWKTTKTFKGAETSSYNISEIRNKNHVTQAYVIQDIKIHDPNHLDL